MTNSSPISQNLTRLALWGALAFTCSATIPGSQASDLSDLSLEELADIPVVESAKKQQKLFDTPAGAFVFDQTAIQDLPVDSIPEMLRYAPGVNIVRASNGVWGMGIRGVNSRFVGRGQFTVDDQNLYGNAYGGLYGAQHDLFLDDIAAIEVVYGPGGGLWGANAVNGQVNVVLKSAFETEGSLLQTQIGTEQNAAGGRVGWSIGKKSAMRVSAKAAHRDASESDLIDDTWDTYRVGLQFDTRPSTSDLFTVSAEAYDSELGYGRNTADLSTGYYSITQSEESHRGFNAQTKWHHQTDSENGFTLRSWLGYTEMRAPYGDFDYRIFGVEGKAKISLSEKQQLSMRATASFDDIQIFGNSTVQIYSDYEPENAYANASLEYSYDITPNLRSSLGLTTQYDTYSKNVELLPSFKLVKSLGEDSRLWLSYSESSRSVPNGMNDVENFVFFGLPMETINIPTPQGNIPVSTQILTATAARDIANEELAAYEIGYRTRITKTTSFVLNAYYYDYSNLTGSKDLGIMPVLSVPNPYLLASTTITNAANGHALGFELSLDQSFGERFQARLSYSFIRDSFDPIIDEGTTLDQIPLQLADLSIMDNNVPEHMFSAWILSKLAERWHIDLGLRASSSYSNLQYKQPCSFQADLRLAYEPNEKLRLSLVGRNLLDPSTDESQLRHNFGIGTEQAREVSAELRYEF